MVDTIGTGRLINGRSAPPGRLLGLPTNGPGSHYRETIMSRLIPSREELDDFVILLKRYSRNAESVMRRNWMRGQNRQRPLRPLSDVWRTRFASELSTLDFLSPFGWSGRC